jgi:RNA polymerase sigma factor (sigma-70 family)
MLKRVEKSDVHQASWEDLLSWAHPILLAFVLRQLRHHGMAQDVADDVVQSACLVAWRKRQHFRGELDRDGVLSWLTVIAKVEIKSLGRSVARARAALGQRSPIEDLLGTPLEPRVFLDGGDSRRFDLIRIIIGALGFLRPNARDLLRRHFFEGIPLRALATEERITVAAIRKRINRSLRRLALVIRRTLEGPPT